MRGTRGDSNWGSSALFWASLFLLAVPTFFAGWFLFGEHFAGKKPKSMFARWWRREWVGEEIIGTRREHTY